MNFAKKRKNIYMYIYNTTIASDAKKANVQQYKLRNGSDGRDCNTDAYEKFKFNSRSFAIKAAKESLAHTHTYVKHVLPHAPNYICSQAQTHRHTRIRVQFILQLFSV